MIKVFVDIKPTLAMLTGAQKQVTFAAAVAMTRTAKRVEKELRKDLATLDATKYTKEGTFITSATKSKLESTIGLKDKKPGRGSSPAQILKEHFTGGVRGNKPMEKAMSAITHGLPSGYVAVPGKGLPLGKYGNPSRKRVSEILGYLKQGGMHAGWHARNPGQSDVGYFVVPVNNTSWRSRHLAPGIWRRIDGGKTGKAVVPVFLFLKRASYRKRFSLERNASKMVKQYFNQEFIAAYQAALVTAK